MPSNASSLDIVDLNNDGENDILACSSLGRYIYFLENKGNQDFDIINKIDIDLYELNSIGSGDINNDEYIDIVYSRYGYNSQLAWLKNNGNNQFTYGGHLYHVPSPGWRTVSFTVADLDGDNVDDIVFSSTNTDHNDLLLRKNLGNGQFQPAISILDTGEVIKYECKDIDTDGDIDIIYSTKNPLCLITAINNGTGDFSNQIINDTNFQDYYYNLLVFDTDNDGDLDIMGFGENDTISLYLNDGENLYSPIYIIKDSLFINYRLEFIDIDNDGDLDVMNPLLQFIENTGNNNFVFNKEYGFQIYPWEYNIYDLNKNGDEDLIFSSRNGSIGYIEDFSIDNSENWRILTSQLFRPMYPSYNKINDDEFPDICIMDYQYKYVFYLNNGFGEFHDTVSLDRLHIYSHESAFYDINKDGFYDIVSYSDYEGNHYNDSSNFKLARNNGDNTFTNYFIEDFEELKHKYANYYDYNEDSILNAVLTASFYNTKTDSIYIFNINHDFTVSPCDTIIFNTPIYIRGYKFYDIDMDSQKDLIINQNNSLIVNYLNDDKFDDDFDTLIISSDDILDFVFATIDNDTLQDLIYSTSTSINVMENFNDSHFGSEYSITTNNYAEKLFAIDINRDSIDELFFLAYDTLGVLSSISEDAYNYESYFYNNHTGTYVDDTPLVFTDIDFDGDLDLLCTYSRESDLSWFENSLIDTLDYSKFPEKDAIWTEQNGIYEGNLLQTWTSLYKTEFDTNLINNSYTNIYEYYLNSSTFDTVRQLFASIRQNVLEKKVYIIRHYLSELKERLLLDFNLNVGDTILLDAYYWNLYPLITDSIFVLDSIGTTIIHNGEEREVQYLSNHKEQNLVSLTLIEGVGSIENPFGPANNLVNKKSTIRTELCCPDYLICLSENDEIVYVQSEESRCNTLEVWTSIETEIQTLLFKIFPNPTKDRINIQFLDKPLTDFEVVVFNNHGSKLSHFYYKKNVQTQTIDFHNYKPGLYLIRINYGSKTNSFKIVKTE